MANIDIGLKSQDPATILVEVLDKKKKKQEGAGAAEAYVPKFDAASYAAGMRVDPGNSDGSTVALLKLLFGG